MWSFFLVENSFRNGKIMNLPVSYVITRTTAIPQRINAIYRQMIIKLSGVDAIFSLCVKTLMKVSGGKCGKWHLFSFSYQLMLYFTSLCLLMINLASETSMR